MNERGFDGLVWSSKKLASIASYNYEEIYHRTLNKLAEL